MQSTIMAHMQTKDQSLLSCWPDGYSRYYSIANILRIIFDKDIKILDVGGDSQWMSRFLDDEKLDYTLNIVDTRKPDFENTSPYVRYTRGDFFKMNPADYPADAVINTDVLEHIPQKLKIPFVNQCIDFASSVVIFSAPQDDEEVTIAEHKINNYYKKYAGKQQYWLKEHFEFGKPNSNKISEAIEKKGLKYVCIDTNNLDNWLLSFSLNFTNSELLELPSMDELNKFYNKNIHFVGDFAGKPYRKIFVVFKDAALYDLKKDELATFFAADSSKKTEFLTKSISALVENYASNYRSSTALIEDLQTRLGLTETNLKQTQDAFVQTSKELNTLKMSKVYKYSTQAKRMLRRKTS